MIVFNATKRVLSKKNYLLIFLFISVAFIFLLISLPVFSIPGNDFAFQLNVFTALDYFTIILFSGLVSLMIAMQVYNYKIKKSIKKVGGGIFGSFSGFVAGIFGTAGCASCIAAVFGFLGAGTLFFLVEKQKYVVGISLLLLLFSIYFTSVGIVKKCKKCL